MNKETSLALGSRYRLSLYNTAGQIKGRKKTAVNGAQSKILLKAIGLMAFLKFVDNTMRVKRLV